MDAGSFLRLRMTSTGTSTATAMRTNPPTTEPAITAVLPPPPLLPEELLDDELPAPPPPDDDGVVGAAGTMTGLLTVTPAKPEVLSEVPIAAMVAELLRPAVSVAVSEVVLKAV